MVRKLPRYLIDRWSREVDCWLNIDDDLRHSEETSSDVREGEMDYPSFSVFCRFLQRESRIACNPVTTVRHQKEEVVKENADKGRKLNGFNRRKPPSFNALATESHEVTDSNINSRKEKKSRTTSCLLCKASHDLNVCKQFLQKSVGERRYFIKTNALCLGCLKWGHMKRICRRLVCKTCNGFLPTSLHSDPASNENEQDSGSRNTPMATSHRVNLSDMKNLNPSCMHSLIVPVWIHHRRDIRKKLLTYALLDEQSDTCFVKEDLLERLDVNGPEVELRLSTVVAEEVIKSRRLEGLVVRGYNEDVEIPLPKSYSRSFIPAKKSQIPRPEYALSWPHLQKISEKIMPLNEDIEVGLPIGLNCPCSIKPLEVISEKDDDPYAKKTALGWGIIGALNDEDAEIKSEIACNRIITREVQGTPKGKMCHFAFKTQGKEMISPSDVSKMFTLDFNERQADENPLSVEDRRFLRTVREGIHQLSDGHFEMPLPLRDENLELPNSKRLALNRPLKLRGRLLSKDQSSKDYCSFMQDIISSYAERVPVEETSTTSKQVWYISHHGVYHKKKPGKIRVVVDCSALRDGQSLNQQPLQGPDLTNIPTGVLCRFRQERIVFMCNIQGMFHQVKVNKEHRNLLRFL